MENNKHLVDLFNGMGLPLRDKQAERLTVRILEKESVIVLNDGKVYADTQEMRAKQFGHGYIVTANGVRDIPFTCWEPSKAARKRMQAKAKATTKCIHTSTDKKADVPERLESRGQMFREGMGRRSRKKPGSGGSFRVNPPLRGMALNRGDIQRNRPDFIDYCKYLNK